MIMILALSCLVLNRKTITLISFSAAWLYLNMCHYISRPKKAQTACSRPTISCSAKYYTKAYPMAFGIFLKVGGLLLKVCANFYEKLSTVYNISHFILLCSSSKTVISQNFLWYIGAGRLNDLIGSYSFLTNQSDIAYKNNIDDIRMSMSLIPHRNEQFIHSQQKVSLYGFNDFFIS